MEPAVTPTRAELPAWRRPGPLLAVAGLIVFAGVLASYRVYMITHPYNWTHSFIDLSIYRDGGLIVRHVRPFYHPHLATPLYDWVDPVTLPLQFTYAPFAAVVFAAVSFVPWRTLTGDSMVANVALLVAALWFTFGGLGMRRGLGRLGATLLTAGAVFWTEPVLRTIYLGQINLALMALIIWDLCQPDTRASRWWKGAGVGIAAGIKLVPLIFIPYLLLARKFRQAAVASAAFALTVVVGFIFVPADSRKWWLGGLFFNGGRTGFVGWEGNQSLRGFITRLSGSVAGSQLTWLVAAVLIAVTGLACAAVLDRAGHQMAAILAVALTGLLDSPISWDHHYVWIVPGVATAGYYAVRAMRSSRHWASSRAGWGYWALAAGMLALYGAWPGSLWGEPRDLGPFSLGLIWQPPNTNPALYYRHGDQPWFVEYRWHGIQMLTGNAYVLGGLGLLAVLVAAAVCCYEATPSGTAGSAAGQAPGGQSPVLREVG